jgi:Spy/CpxP family protein refolding chaperone
MTIRRVLISLALLTGMTALAPVSAMADEYHHPVHHHHHPVCHYEHHHKVCH